MVPPRFVMAPIASMPDTAYLTGKQQRKFHDYFRRP